uniref:YfbK domain-containing protein n=1 Tax=Flavobacterium sp. TaxID=239 RepID=UPI004049A4F3
MKKIKIFSLGIAMLITFLNFATTNHSNASTNYKTITGIVSDALGPLAGANVNIKGTLNGTTTDFNGKYTIVANEGDILVFTYTGMTTKTETVGKTSILNVTMEDTILKGMEVVVVAQGISKEKKQKGYQVSINENQVEERYNGNTIVDVNAPAYHKSEVVSRKLSGKVAGVQITNSNATTNNFIFRGSKSVLENDNVLIIVDNKITTAEELQKIAPENIEKTHQIKGIDAAVIYGSKASNGVIHVVTKDGLNKEEKEKLIKSFEKPYTLIEPEQEEYELFVENQFTSPKSEPLSTFSIDVDNASYTNVRRFINQGQKVPKDAVRIEEMMNFFKYNYPQPTSKHPFAIQTEYSDCPWNEKHKLVKIGLQGKDIDSDVLPNSNFVFLIDVSGSMSSQNKLPLLKESMKVLVKQLRENDRVSIVVYAGAAGLVLPPTSGNSKETILKSLENLNAGGSTAGGAGIELAYKIASENFIKGGNNRVILATDGDFNVGASSNKDMETLIEEKRKSGVFLTCLGYGMGNYKDSKMETLADKGNGNYAYIDNIQEANRFLGKEFKGSMFTIAKDVKIQIEFNPKHVQNYRLIGYENRKLRPEDFKNDAIDAGELGSGHTVTALYEIIPTGVNSSFNNDIDTLKYTEQKTPTEKYTDELATVKFRYKKPDGDKSIEMIQVIENKSIKLENASEDFKFTTAVAWFGLKLRDSKLVNNKSSKDIKELALHGKSVDKEGYKAEFIRLVDAVN